MLDSGGLLTLVYCFPGSKLKILFYGPFIKNLPGKEPQAQSHPPCPRWGVVRLAVLRGDAVGVFPAPLEKTVDVSYCCGIPELCRP